MDKKFETYYNYLISENQKYNLTAITDMEEVFVKHFEDSLTAADLIPHNASVLDIGAGAGFPSVPLKLVRDDITVTMLDSVGKKADFLNKLIGLLKLERIKAIHVRVEDYMTAKTNPPTRPEFDIVTARAVAPLNTLAEYALPFVKIGGKFIAYKSSEIDNEINNAQNALKILGGKIIKTKHVTLLCKDEKINRSLVVVAKISETPPQYPRKGNKPRLQAL